MQFNDRVLDEANSKGVPLLERLKFLGISASNLDEFFMIRFPSVLREESSDPQIRDQILEAVLSFHSRQERCHRSLKKQLQEEGIEIVTDKKQIETLGAEIFESEIAAHLDVAGESLDHFLSKFENHRVGFIFSNGLSYKLPPNLDSFYLRRIEKNFYIFILDDLVEVFLQKLHPHLGKPIRFRMTRDADVRVDIDSEDPEAIPDIVKKRVRSRDEGKWTRCLIRADPQVNPDTLLQKIKVPPSQCFFLNHSLLLKACFEAACKVSGELSSESPLVYPPVRSYLPKELSKPSQIFSSLLKRDYLLHHPYDSFEAVVNFVRAAVDDPNVLSIQQTVYRVDALSEVTNLLKKAASQKKVSVYIEPRARFDELNNIQLAEDLRRAGVKVVFPFGEWKIHAKLILVERKDPGGKRERFTHLSTGNYNSKTARLYTDFGVLTARPQVGEDAALFFDSIRKGEVPTQLSHLLVAPTQLHKRLQLLIAQETREARSGKDARIVVKVNALVDRKIIQSLYAASQAGVKLDLIVRGACSLVPGIPELSENIRVISIVDRYLEHSRIYYFQSSNQLYLSSADWMPRNFFSRLEIAYPILDERIFRYITQDVIPCYLADNQKARRLHEDGKWRPVKDSKSQDHRAQFVFEKFSQSEYRNTQLANSISF